MSNKIFDLNLINLHKSTSFAKASEILDGTEVMQHYGVDVCQTDLSRIMNEVALQKAKLQKKLDVALSNYRKIPEKVRTAKNKLESAEMARRLILKNEDEKWLYTDDGNPFIEQLEAMKCDLNSMINIEKRTDSQLLYKNYEMEIRGVKAKLKKNHTLFVNAVKKIKGKLFAEKLTNYSDTIPQYNRFYQGLIDKD